MASTSTQPIMEAVCPRCHNTVDIREFLQHSCEQEEQDFRECGFRKVNDWWVCDWPDCGHKARQKTNMKTHYMRHTKEKPYTCPHPAPRADSPGGWAPCKYKTGDPACLTRHRKICHGYTPVPRAPKGTSTAFVKREQRAAKRLHPYVCFTGSKGKAQDINSSSTFQAVAGSSAVKFKDISELGLPVAQLVDAVGTSSNPINLDFFPDTATTPAQVDIHPQILTESDSNVPVPNNIDVALHTFPPLLQSKPELDDVDRSLFDIARIDELLDSTNLLPAYNMEPYHNVEPFHSNHIQAPFFSFGHPLISAPRSPAEYQQTELSASTSDFLAMLEALEALTSAIPDRDTATETSSVYSAPLTPMDDVYSLPDIEGIGKDELEEFFLSASP